MLLPCLSPLDIVHPNHSSTRLSSKGLHNKSSPLCLLQMLLLISSVFHRMSFAHFNNYNYLMLLIMFIQLFVIVFDIRRFHIINQLPPLSGNKLGPLKIYLPVTKTELKIKIRLLQILFGYISTQSYHKVDIKPPGHHAVGYSFC